MDDEIKTNIMKFSIGLFESGHKIEQIIEIISKIYPNSDYIIISGIEMYRSLTKACDEARGGGYNIQRLCKMTVMDLISKLATNHVRFIFEKQK